MLALEDPAGIGRLLLSTRCLRAERRIDRLLKRRFSTKLCEVLFREEASARMRYENVKGPDLSWFWKAADLYQKRAINGEQFEFRVSRIHELMENFNDSLMMQLLKKDSAAKAYFLALQYHALAVEGLSQRLEAKGPPRRIDEETHFNISVALQRYAEAIAKEPPRPLTGDAFDSTPSAAYVLERERQLVLLLK